MLLQGQTQRSFELDDDHRDFREVCRSFVEREVMPLVRDAERTHTFPPQLWGKLADAGLLGIGHPEEHGGSGGGVLALVVLAEQLARASGGIAVTPLVSSYMAAPHLARFGTPEQRRLCCVPIMRRREGRRDRRHRARRRIRRGGHRRPARRRDERRLDRQRQ